MAAASVLRRGLARYLSEDQLARLASVRVGVAGAGGLGSNTALMLARTGVRRFLVIDGDTVEPSNLNRQQYFPEDVGSPKVEALERLLHRLDDTIDYEGRVLLLTEKNAPGLVREADLWVEAFDAPESKRVIVEAAMLAGLPVTAASGMGGWGGPVMRRRELGLLTLVGDFENDILRYPPLAPKVSEAAALMADAVVARLLGPCEPRG